MIRKKCLIQKTLSGDKIILSHKWHNDGYFIDGKLGKIKIYRMRCVNCGYVSMIKPNAH
jgi:hypothetical protein